MTHLFGCSSSHGSMPRVSATCTNVSRRGITFLVASWCMAGRDARQCSANWFSDQPCSRQWRRIRRAIWSRRAAGRTGYFRSTGCSACQGSMRIPVAILSSVASVHLTFLDVRLWTVGCDSPDSCASWLSEMRSRRQCSRMRFASTATDDWAKDAAP